jgi:hypothetical protein
MFNTEQIEKKNRAKCVSRQNAAIAHPHTAVTAAAAAAGVISD